MSFIIVSTKEKGKPQLCIVPAHWEIDEGYIRWPKKNADKLTRNHNSKPTPDWTRIKCKVKRRNFLSYEAADIELQVMLENTDTEHEDEQSTYFRRPRQRQEQVNLNSLVETLISPETNDSGTTPLEFGTLEAQTSQEYVVVAPDPVDSPVQSLPELTDVQNILQNQTILFDTISNVIANQKKIMHELACLSVQIEELNRNSVVTLGKASNVEKTPFIMNQIKNIKDLEDMELLLSNYEEKIKLIKTCSIICSPGPGKGISCAYRLVDVLFCRDFLCKCSWSGSTRGDSVKISLKCYKKILDFFFTAINQWDNQYTLEDNETFFKNVLKNSNKRKNAKLERIPTKRQRSKNILDNGQMAIEKRTKEKDKENYNNKNILEAEIFKETAKQSNNNSKNVSEEEESLC